MTSTLTTAAAASAAASHINSDGVCSVADKPDLRVRIVNVDHYMTEPNVRFDDLYSQFRQSETKRVPILRVFGTTDDGRKICLHIHRVYPYLSVKFDAILDDNYEYNKQQFMSQLVAGLESCLMPARVRTRNAAKDSPNDQLIYDIQEVDAIPFYGFHEKHDKFLRIYFYNPWTVKKASEHLLSGDVMGRQIQPFEAHIPYTLQFFIDHNLYGMNFLDATRVVYRQTDLMPDCVNYSDIEPMSSCQLECDIDLNDIMNKDVMLDNNQRIPGLESIWREALNRCKDSTEAQTLKGLPSQERTGVTVTERETKLLQKLFDGLAKLDIKTDDNSESTFGDTIGETQFAEMIINCIDNNSENSLNQINDTIDEVINNSQTLAINHTIEDVIHNSQNEIISQTIESVVKESAKQSKCRKQKRKTASKGGASIRRLILLSSGSSADNNDGQSSDVSTELEDTEYDRNVVFADACTQTETGDEDMMDDAMDGLFDDTEQQLPAEEVVCDCDSDECCDQCCDRQSDQCECDCEKCEYEKVGRIPQLDGAFDSDDDESGSDFKPNRKDESDDESDYEAAPKRGRKKPTPKKRTHSSRSKPAPKRNKTSITRASDDSDADEVDTYSTSRSSRRKPAARQSRQSPDVSDKDDDVFQSSSGRTVKSTSKVLSARLFDQIKPTSRTSADNGSPIHMSFSESDGSDRDTKTTRGTGLNFMGTFAHKSSPSKSKDKRFIDDEDNRSDRSLTPYLSDVSDDKPSRTKPGPHSSKASSRAGPTSSKPGPKSSKAAPKPGPKSSKTSAPVAARPGPKSSKIGPKSSKKSDYIALDSDPSDGEDYYTSSARSRRSGAKAVNYDDTNERTSTIYSSSKTKPKAAAKRKPAARTTAKQLADEVQSAIDSITPSFDLDDNVSDGKSYSNNIFSSTSDYLLSPKMVWREFDADIIQVDENYYQTSIIDAMVTTDPKVSFKLTPDYIIKPYLERYDNNQDYWDTVRAELDLGLNGGSSGGGGGVRKGRTGGTKSKGALKDFYTLPQLNERAISKSPERPAPAPKATTASKKSATKKPSNRGADEVARLVSEASDLINKPLGKRGAQSRPAAKATPAPKPKAAPVVAKKSVTPKAGGGSKSKSSASKSKSRAKSGGGAKAGGRDTSRNRNSKRSSARQRVPRGVTSATVFNAISIPFYESDIVSVTDLTGHKKRSHLKALCDDFELNVDKLPERYLNRYRHHEISPFLFDNIYYNDYSGLLPDEESQFTQDVLIVMKELVSSVVSVSQCVNQIVKDVEQEIEPQPMIDIDEYYESPVDEESNDWNYEEEEQEVIGIAVDEYGVAIGAVEKSNDQNYETTANVFENGINGTADPLSEALLKTFGEDNDDNNSNDGQVNGAADCGEEEERQQEVEDNGYESHGQRAVQQSGDEGIEESNEQIAQEVEKLCAHTQPQQHRYSEIIPLENSNDSSVEQNAAEYQTNQYEGQEEEEEDDDEEEDPNSNQSNGLPGDQCLEPFSTEPVSQPSPLRQFRMSSTNYNTQQVYDPYNSGSAPAQSQPQYHQNPLQNPIVPTLQVPHNTVGHYPNANLFAAQQSWPQTVPAVSHQLPVQQMQYNMPSIDTSVAAQPQSAPDCEFDNSYMGYYPYNPNIPQFDGIFDDDSFHSEGNQFNCTSNDNETLDQLSQGSRSEEMSATVGSAKRKIADVVSDALLNADHKVARDERWMSATVGPRNAYCQTVETEPPRPALSSAGIH